MTTLGMSTVWNQVLRDQSLFTELFLVQLKDSWQSWLSTWEVNGLSGYPRVRLLSFQLVRKPPSIVKVSTSIYTDLDSSVPLTDLQVKSTRKSEMPS
jgi:hypothetical protein